MKQKSLAESAVGFVAFGRIVPAREAKPLVIELGEGPVAVGAAAVLGDADRRDYPPQ
jgi:hypothetical protein